MMNYKSILRPVLVWTFVATVFVSLALSSVSIITERATFAETSGVLMLLIGTLGGACITYVFGRSQEKIAGKDADNVDQVDNGGVSADSN